MDFSREFGLAAQVIEKDYVLGWLLAGIFNHPVIGSSWVFKGGTCLKKCLIEPYSLRRTQEGNILLYALRHETNEWRAYRVDRIQGAEITETPFVPKHEVELTPAGPISI
jgi:hypothetical protein